MQPTKEIGLYSCKPIRLSVLGIKDMKEALHPFGMKLFTWKSVIACSTSLLTISQRFLINPKLNTSGPGLLVPSHCHTAALISPSEITPISFSLSCPVIKLNYFSKPNLEWCWVCKSLFKVILYNHFHHIWFLTPLFEDIHTFDLIFLSSPIH